MTCLVLHCASEEWLQHAVVNLYLFRVIGKEQEPLRVLFEALAPLQEHHESLQGSLAELETFLEHVLD